RRAGIERADAGVFRRREAEMAGDLAQVLVLGGADLAVGEGNVEEAAEQVLEHGPVAGEEPPDLPCIAFEPVGAAPRQVENEAHVLLFARRHLEHLAERGDLVARHLAVGPRHLGAERDDRDRKGDAAPRVVDGARLGVEMRQMRQMRRDPLEQGTDRATVRPLAGAVENAANDTHATSLPQCSMRGKVYAGELLVSGGSRPSSTAWQATSAPSAAISSGRSARQRSLAKGQRGWKAQPGGGSIGLGTSPATGSLSPEAPLGGSRRGIVSIRRRVYGCRGRANSSSDAAISTSRPRYMTPTRSET